MRFVLLFVMALINGCSCKCYKYLVEKEVMPIELEGKGRDLYLCGSAEAAAFTFPESESEYQVTPDSVHYGYVGVLHYIDRKPVLSVNVGAGSEFRVGSCWFRVVKVYPPHYKDTTENGIFWYNNILLQTLEVSKGCRKVNNYLKAYDEKGLPPNWEVLKFKQ
jgi:hypothetical protein